MKGAEHSGRAYDAACSIGNCCLAKALEHMRKRVSHEMPRGRKERSWATGASAIVLALMMAAGPHLLVPAVGAQDSCRTAMSRHVAYGATNSQSLARVHLQVSEHSATCAHVTAMHTQLCRQSR